MRLKNILSVLCLLTFAATAETAPAQEASDPAAPGAQAPGDTSEASAPDAAHDKSGTRGPSGEGDRRPPGWTIVTVALLDGDTAGQAGPDTRGDEDPQAGPGAPGARGPAPGQGAGEASGPVRLTTEETSSVAADANAGADARNAESGTARGGMAYRCQLIGVMGCYEAPRYAPEPGAEPGTRGAGPDAGRGADGRATAKSGAASPDSGAVARITLGLSLASLGREARSPYALAAAAELLASAGTADSETGKAGIEGDPAPAGSVPTDEPVTDPKALFAEAAELARSASNDQLAAQIELSAAASGSRSPVGRSARHRDRADPYATDVYTVMFRGGEAASATAAADSRHDVDLYVYDDSGSLVSCDNDTAGMGICSWFPESTKNYFLAVKNTTGSYVSYLLYTN
ncbi:MAG: hypothetical protein LBT40_12820 [Deltaproteobacteria bacterium]|jgi:hypothetical protein|nr:hypothetical protein [Deltaproteobacteria bacterium]